MLLRLPSTDLTGLIRSRRNNPFDVEAHDNFIIVSGDTSFRRADTTSFSLFRLGASANISLGRNCSNLDSTYNAVFKLRTFPWHHSIRRHSGVLYNRRVLQVFDKFIKSFPFKSLVCNIWRTIKSLMFYGIIYAYILCLKIPSCLARSGPSARGRRI